MSYTTSEKLQLASTIAARLERKGQAIAATEAMARAENAIAHAAEFEALLAAQPVAA